VLPWFRFISHVNYEMGRGGTRLFFVCNHQKMNYGSIRYPGI